MTPNPVLKASRYSAFTISEKIQDGYMVATDLQQKVICGLYNYTELGRRPSRSFQFSWVIVCVTKIHHCI